MKFPLKFWSIEEDWDDYTEKVLMFVSVNSAGTESIRGFFSPVLADSDDDSGPRKFPFLVTAILTTLAWVAGPIILDIYVENETGKTLESGYGIFLLASSCGLMGTLSGAFVAMLYSWVLSSVLESDKMKPSLGIQLFILVSFCGLVWSIAAGILALFSQEWLIIMYVFLVVFVLRAVTAGAFSMCKGSAKSFPYTLSVGTWLADVGNGLLGGFIFYLIMSSSGFIIEATEIPTFRNACLILGALQNPVLMPLLPYLSPNLYRYG